MASAQVLPSSRKQELAEAGRRKLEQFRKKRAAEKAKKTPSHSSPQPTDETTKHPQVTEPDEAVTSKSDDPVGIAISNDKTNESFTEIRQTSSNKDGINLPFPRNEYVMSSKETMQKDASNQELQNGEASRPDDIHNSIDTNDSINDLTERSISQDLSSGRTTSEQFSSIDKGASESDNNVLIRSNFYGLKDSISKQSDSTVSGVSPQTYGNAMSPSVSNPTYKDGYGHRFTSSYEEFLQPTTSMTASVFVSQKSENGSGEFKEIKVSDAEGQLSTSAGSLFTPREIHGQSSEYSSFSLDERNSLPIYLARNEMNPKRSRPSFLDSLNIPRASTETHYQHSETEKGSTMSSGPRSNAFISLGSSTFQNSSVKAGNDGQFSNLEAPDLSNSFERSGNSLVSVANGSSMGYNDFPPPKQNDDFAALEQHIEDLTQEKFSLQRALEASRALAESLASENSSLTDSYNQQRTVVNELKADMTKLQEEIQAQMVEFESIRNEYANAQLECNASDERAKILASEVIVLEDKVLRLRSSELKLERELENAEGELSTYKRKISSLEKDRQDLQATINALQEEKKILQSKLRKAPSGGKFAEFGTSANSRKDMSTSTEDLESSSNRETHSTANLESDASSFTMMPENEQSALEVISVNIPADQMRMIENINTLISELALEKEELVQALSSEQSQSAKLKELNKELSRKLEAQTQRLEFLTAKNMANDNTSTRLPEPVVVNDSTPYADEGDEVVERVLGWIMKLFPGGPSRRRTSKLI